MCAHFVLCLCTLPLALKKGFFARRAMKVVAFGVEMAKQWRVYRAGRGCHFSHPPQPRLFVLFVTARNPHGQSPSCAPVSDAESEAEGSQHLPASSQRCDLWVRQRIHCFFPALGANTKGFAVEFCTGAGGNSQSLKWARPAESGSTSTPPPMPSIPKLTLGRRRFPWP